MRSVEVRKGPGKLIRQRCFHHASREAVARCPECQRFFCRECVIEHDDRLLCSACLAQQARPSFAKRYHLGGLVKALRLVLAFLALWWCFYLLGQMLLHIPGAFHEGVLWYNVL
jgi:hypothetical protein